MPTNSSTKSKNGFVIYTRKISREVEFISSSMFLPNLFRFVEGFNRSFPFRVAYKQVLAEVEEADEESKRVKRAPRSYEESDKKLKSVKIVTKKGDVSTDEQKKKKTKQMAAPAKPSTVAAPTVEEDEIEEDEPQETQQPIEETKVEPAEVENEEKDERNPLEEIQLTTKSVAEILKAKGRKSSGFTKAAPALVNVLFDSSLDKLNWFLSKPTGPAEKAKPAKAKAPANASKMDTTGLDYSGATASGKVVRILSRRKIQSVFSLHLYRSDASLNDALCVFQDNGRFNNTAPIAARPEQGDLKTMAIEYVTNCLMAKRSSILHSFFRAASLTSGLVDNFWSKLKKVNVFASKTLTADDLRTGVDTMREHLISKNVAADVADKICESVSTKLAGKTLGSFESLTTNIRQAMRETLMTILTPKRRIDILRDVVDAQRAQRPYVITFCGVNGVGKSTNLAKVIDIWTSCLLYDQCS